MSEEATIAEACFAQFRASQSDLAMRPSWADDGEPRLCIPHDAEPRSAGRSDGRWASMPTLLEGGCHCGDVRFQIDDVFDAGYCRCSICRRMSGAPAVAWANVERARFRLISGTPSGYETSARWTRYFCGACGAPVYQCDPDGSDDDPICVLIPTLDDPEAVRPTVHMWCASGLSYFETTDDSPRFPHGEISHPRTRGPNRVA